MSLSEIRPIEAESLLFAAGDRNPGPWVAHSLLAGYAAKRIATADARLNPDQAFVMGLLHDIGRLYGPSGLRHVTDGYKYLDSLGLRKCARVSLSHSFPDGRLDTYLGEPDVEPEDLNLLKAYLQEARFSDYDRLIQLCDFISDASGYCPVEVRMVDTVLRHHIKETPHSRWVAVFEILKEFDHRIGTSVYALLPGIVESTFGKGDLPRLSASDPETQSLLAARERFGDPKNWKAAEPQGQSSQSES